MGHKIIYTTASPWLRRALAPEAPRDSLMLFNDPRPPCPSSSPPSRVSDPLPASHRPRRPPPPAGPATGPARALPGPPQVASLRESFRLAPGVGPSGSLPGGVLKVCRPGPSARPSAAGGSRVPHRPGVPAGALFPKGLVVRFPPPSEGVYQGPPSGSPLPGTPCRPPPSIVSLEALPGQSARTLRRDPPPRPPARPSPGPRQGSSRKVSGRGFRRVRLPRPPLEGLEPLLGPCGRVWSGGVVEEFPRRAPRGCRPMFSRCGSITDVYMTEPHGGHRRTGATEAPPGVFGRTPRGGGRRWGVFWKHLSG